MNDHRKADTKADGGTGRDPAVSPSEVGMGIVHGGEGEEADTHLPASEEDSDLIEDKDESPPQSWPGDGSPGTIPPPG